jgi:hypothetical protein
VAVGTGKLDDSGKKIEFNVKVGDKVLISKYGGTEKIAGVEVFLTEGRSSELPRSSFITLVAFAIASTPDTARTMPTKPLQLCQNPPESGFKLCQASPRCGKEKNPRTTTVITVGTETATANSPVRFGPKKFRAPIPRIASPAKISGCGTPAYWNPDRALIDAVTM